nr:uncharacterized protein LOC120367900 [Saimiri boliviensis boliviensis]
MAVGKLTVSGSPTEAGSMHLYPFSLLHILLLVQQKAGGTSSMNAPSTLPAFLYRALYTYKHLWQPQYTVVQSLGDCRPATGLQDFCPQVALDKIQAQRKLSSTVKVLNTDLENGCSMNSYQLLSDNQRASGIILNFLRLGEQPAAPRPRSLCLRPPGARGPAQPGHAGTEEAERTGSDGETGEEPAKRHRHHHHQPPPPSLTVAHPSSPASPPISYPCAVPTLSDHLLFTGYDFGKATECAKLGISTSAVGHLSSRFHFATSIFPSGKGAQRHFISPNHTEMAGLLPVCPVLYWTVIYAW